MIAVQGDSVKRLIRKVSHRVRKIAGVKEVGAQHEAGFPKVKGPRYEAWFIKFFAETPVGWYLEVGTESGKSLRAVNANTISIDPAYNLRYDVMGSKSALHLFQMSSDDFFATDFLTKNNIRIDVSFLDGMHQFEFLLRDFINVERVSNTDGIVLMHDCIPANHIQARRHHSAHNSRFWAGDVWKLLPILQAYRPDVTVEVLDLAPTGLVKVRNLDPDNTTLSESYDKIVAEYAELELEDYGLSKFARNFALIPAALNS